MYFWARARGYTDWTVRWLELNWCKIYIQVAKQASIHENHTMQIIFKSNHPVWDAVAACQPHSLMLGEAWAPKHQTAHQTTRMHWAWSQSRIRLWVDESSWPWGRGRGWWWQTVWVNSDQIKTWSQSKSIKSSYSGWYASFACMH